MKWIFLLCAWLGAESANTAASDLQRINELNECVQVRFQTDRLAPRAGTTGINLGLLSLNTRLFPDAIRADEVPALGMSRMASPPSFGEHFVPNVSAIRDFQPENERELKVITGLEADSVQVGFYLFGKAITRTGAETLNFRALKGPAAITLGTPRPGWYPTVSITRATPDALPDWRTIYPLAQKEMKSFEDGGGGFETSIGSWHVVARPFVASQERCVACHNMARDGSAAVELKDVLGGALYAFRRSRS